ncbi:hypothetical protein MPER_11448 [Moniliophthora perniciosa FA553]|nr:hypothetical protein MPER_11448 [Moniliophthora perniciosa FA553]
MFIQVLIYHTSLRQDHWYTKATVWFVFSMECISSALAITTPTVCLAEFEHFVEQADAWSFQALSVLSGLVTFIVHCFYAWRIWVLGGNLFVSLAVAVLTLIQCTGGHHRRKQGRKASFSWESIRLASSLGFLRRQTTKYRTIHRSMANWQYHLRSGDNGFVGYPFTQRHPDTQQLEDKDEGRENHDGSSRDRDDHDLFIMPCFMCSPSCMGIA